MAPRPPWIPRILLAVVMGACGRSSLDPSGDLSDSGATVDAGRHDVSPSDPPVCPDGQRHCHGACVPEGPAACGPSCAVCPESPFGVPVCKDGACDVACQDGYVRCDHECCAPQVAAGWSMSCFVDEEGQASCWGEGSSGELGDGAGESTSTPVKVLAPGLRILSIAAGGIHACAVVSGGAVYCWGGNSSGQLGDGTFADHAMPQPVQGIASGATVVSVGNMASCAVVNGSVLSVLCWGSLDSGASFASRPRLVDGIGPGEARAVTVGRQHACALMVDGGVRCWGYGHYLGNGPNTKWSHTAVPVSKLASGIKAVGAGFAATCALDSSGKVSCWGENLWSQLGISSPPTLESFPVQVQGLTEPATALAVGAFHVCVLTTRGTVSCWGSSAYQQYPGPTTWRATEVTGFAAPPQSLAAGYSHTCAWLGDRAVACWGGNHSGQLGDGTLTPTSNPRHVSGL